MDLIGDYGVHTRGGKSPVFFFFIFSVVQLFWGLGV